MIKKLLLLMCYIYVMMQIMPIFGMIQESMKQISIVDWSELFHSTETFQRSFVFATTNEHKKIILIQSNERVYFFACEKQDNKKKSSLKAIASAMLEGQAKGEHFDFSLLGCDRFPDIECYIPFVYEENNAYSFFIISKVMPKKWEIFSKEKYAVGKIIINMTAKKIVYEFLFEHNTPIMHLGMIEHDKKKYLVSGSFF